MSIRTLSLLGLALAGLARAGAHVTTDVGFNVHLGADRQDHRHCHHRHARGWHGHSEPREVVVVEKRVVEPQPVLVVKETTPAPAPQPVAPPEPPRPSRSMNSAD